MIIGLSGYARSGKDTAGKILADEFGFQTVAFADKMRDALYALNPIVDVDAARMKKTLYYVQDVIDSFGWDGYKETPYGPEIRRLLQRFGTEAGRDILGEDVWVDATLRDLTGDIAVTDVRFPNEARAISRRGGTVVRISRPGVKPANDHISENSMEDYNFDAYIHNDGDIDALKYKIKSFMEIVDVSSRR